MNKLLYISTGLPEEEVKKIQKKQCNFASNAIMPISVFHRNIVLGHTKVYDEVQALCGVPISYKYYKILRYKSKRIEKDGVKYVIPGFLNISGIKQITVIIKLFFHIVSWLAKNKKHNTNVIIDGSFYTGLVPLWLASKLFNIKSAAILVDYYAFMHPKQTTLAQKFYYKMLKSIKCFAFVTKQLEAEVNVDKKDYMIMEGLVHISPEDGTKKEVEDYCMYAGGLHQMYGLKDLVDAVHESSIPYSLHLYGNGDTIEYIQEISKIDARIQYKGVVSHDELLEIEQRAKLLVNPRPVHGKLDTRFNFPSKLMEFMQSGRPVITTRLLGIPEDYEQRMYFFEGDTKEELKKGLERVLSIDEKELAAFGNDAKKYINDNKNNVARSRQMFEMLNSKDN